MKKSKPTQAAPNVSTWEKLNREMAYYQNSLKYAEEENQFLQKFIKTGSLSGNVPNMFENLKDFLEKLEKKELERQTLFAVFSKYKNEIHGLRECEDVECDLFYENEHEQMKLQLFGFFENYQNLKLDIFRYTENYLG